MKLTIKQIIIYNVVSFFISFFIFSAPIALFVNLLIFTDYFNLLLLLIFLMGNFTILLQRVIYYDMKFRKINYKTSFKSSIYDILPFLVGSIVSYIIIILVI